MADLKKIMAAIAADKPVQYKSVGGVWTDVVVATENDVANVGALMADLTRKWRLKPASVVGVFGVYTLASAATNPDRNPPTFSDPYESLEAAQRYFNTPAQLARFKVYGYVRTTLDTDGNTVVSEFIKGV